MPEKKNCIRHPVTRLATYTQTSPIVNSCFEMSSFKMFYLGESNLSRAVLQLLCQHVFVTSNSTKDYTVCKGSDCCVNLPT